MESIQFLDIPSILEFKQNCMNLSDLNIYGCMVEYINYNAKAMYIFRGAMVLEDIEC